MSEAFPLPNTGGTKKPLTAVPEAAQLKPKFNFASHGQEELSLQLENGLRDEQLNAIKHVLEKAPREGEAVKLMIGYAAEIAGMLPSSNAENYSDYQTEFRLKVNGGLASYYENFIDKSGRTNIDKVVELHDATDDYSDSSILQILHSLKTHTETSLPKEYFVTAERVIRVLISNELSDKPV